MGDLENFKKQGDGRAQELQPQKPGERVNTDYWIHKRTREIRPPSQEMDISDSVLDLLVRHLANQAHQNPDAAENSSRRTGLSKPKTCDVKSVSDENLIGPEFYRKQELLRGQHLGPYYNREPEGESMTTRELMLRAITHYRDSEYEDALICFKKVLQKRPNSLEVLIMLGATYFQNKMNEEALQVYERLKQLAPDNATVHDNLGHIYCTLSDFESAAKEWRVLLDLLPKRIDLHERLDEITMSAKHKTGTDPNGDEHQKLLTAGIEYYRRSNYDLAVRAFKLAAKILPDSQTYSLLGNVYFRNGKLKQAAAAYEEAVALDQENIAAIENLAKIYSWQGAVDRAIDAWEKILAISPERTDIFRKIDEVIHFHQ